MAYDKPEEMASKLYSIADEMRAVANLGLRYAENEYDRERYEQVLAASARLVGAVDDTPHSAVLAKFRDNLDHVSPLLGAEAAVFRDNRLLLIQRHDDALWAVPGGLVEVGETLTSAALRELEEETGLTGTFTRLLGVFDSRLWRSQSKSHLYHVIFEADAPDGTPIVTSEATDWGFFTPDELPSLSPGHAQRIPILFKLKAGEIKPPYFDGPDDQPLQ